MGGGETEKRGGSGREGREEREKEGGWEGGREKN